MRQPGTRVPGTAVIDSLVAERRNVCSHQLTFPRITRRHVSSLRDFATRACLLPGTCVPGWRMPSLRDSVLRLTAVKRIACAGWHA